MKLTRTVVHHLAREVAEPAARFAFIAAAATLLTFLFARDMFVPLLVVTVAAAAVALAIGVTVSFTAPVDDEPEERAEVDR